MLFAKGHSGHRLRRAKPTLLAQASTLLIASSSVVACTNGESAASPRTNFGAVTADAKSSTEQPTCPPDTKSEHDPVTNATPEAVAKSPDWQSAPLATTKEKGKDVMTLRAEILDGFLFVLVDSARDDLHHTLWLDTDPAARSAPGPNGGTVSGLETGAVSASWISSSGADFAISWGGDLYQGPVYRPDADVRVTEHASALGHAYQYRIPIKTIGYDASKELGIAFEWTGCHGVATLKVPEGTSFARLVPAGKPAYDVNNCRTVDMLDRTAPEPDLACDEEVFGHSEPVLTSESFEVGQGMIIPAYFGAEKAAAWQAVLDGASAAASSRTKKDYWVTINGPDNRPPRSADGLANRAHWNQLITAGAKVFGYVHATCLVKDRCLKGSRLRPLQDVMQDITNWVCTLPGLSGIWIDEFYPKLELTKENVDPIVPDLEEDGLITPINRCFLDGKGALISSIPVEPKGGYFDHLTDWIHRTYKPLRIIGNAGSPLISNLKAYGPLVDVLVSYEDSYFNATSEHAQDGTKINDHKLTAPDPAAQKFQAALFHSTATTEDMTEILKKAMDLQYTHVYASHVVYVDLNTSDTWGELASYFTDELPVVFPGYKPANSDTSESSESMPDPVEPDGLDGGAPSTAPPSAAPNNFDNSDGDGNTPVPGPQPGTPDDGVPEEPAAPNDGDRADGPDDGDDSNE